MTDPRVAIVKGKEPSKMVSRALELIGAEDLVSHRDRVLIKPNYVVAKRPSIGFTTDTRIVESIIRFLRKHMVEELVVAEGGAGDTEEAFDVVGIRDIVSRHHVELINLNRDSRINLEVSDYLALKRFDVAQTALQNTCIVNVPKLKVHHMATVTLCMKNLMGFILPKNIMHSRINEKIVDLASLFKDRVKINIVDGLVGAEINETSGSPVIMNLVISGQDMVAVDTVATAVMGIDPSRVGYLGLAQERGLGISNLQEIEILGEEIEKVRRPFRV